MPAFLGIDAAAIVKNAPGPQGDCTTGGSSVSGTDWQVVLRQWLLPHPRSGRYRGKRGDIEYADERVERLFGLPEGSVQECLHIVDGRPTRYGVAVHARPGQPLTSP